MGMDRRITPGGSFDWQELCRLLARKNFAIQMRMIDGELAFSDEEPPASWRELRIGTPQGMITLRRDEGAIAVVTWGNADAGLRQAWNAVSWAVATATGGVVDCQLPVDFAAAAELPPEWRG